MSTICTGRLTVTGSKAELREFKQYASNGCIPLSAESFLEPPKVGRKKWCLINWGSEEDFIDPLLEIEDDQQLQYGFTTKKSPINPVVRSMSEQFKTLRFHYAYFELVNFYNGSITLQAGKVLDEKFEYKSVSQRLRNRLQINWEQARRVVRKKVPRGVSRWF